MKLHEWYAARGPGYIQKRAAALLSRYGITPSKAAERVIEGVEWLADLGCAPTFPVPGRVVQQHPRYFQQLQNAGVEIAVHAYDHVALAKYPPAEAAEQLIRAAETFAQYGIEFHGFRCPYLSCTKDLISALPGDLFKYSSNAAIEWDVIAASDEPIAHPDIAQVLQRVYKPASAREALAVPSFSSGILEIPVCLPDDLELHDARRLDAEAMGEVWGQVLLRTHERGELFVLMYHPELMVACRQPLSVVLKRAAKLRPAVWIARLCEISSWWAEKAKFSVGVQPAPDGLHLAFTCSERATILVRDVQGDGALLPWDNVYKRLVMPALNVPVEPRPLLGLDPDAPAQAVCFLQEQGYLLDTGPTAPMCAVYIDSACLSRMSSGVELVRYIEESRGPLVRYGRWPGGARSALSITGDLDALTLLDYAARLFVR